MIMLGRSSSSVRGFALRSRLPHTPSLTHAAGRIAIPHAESSSQALARCRRDVAARRWEGTLSTQPPAGEDKTETPESKGSKKKSKAKAKPRRKQPVHVETAARLAQVLKADSSSTASPTSRRKRSAYGDSDSSSTPPELEDFRRVMGKQRKHDRMAEYDYRKRLYDNAFKRIDHAFNVKQLRSLLSSLSVTGSKSQAAGIRMSPKPILIQKLMENEDWPAPIDEASLDAQEAKTYDLAPNELFLFLRDTQAIQTMMSHGVTFSVVDASDTPGSETAKLKAEGPGSRLKLLDKTIEGRRRHMSSSHITPDDLRGFTMSNGLVHFISIVTGAYIENHDSHALNSFRITSMDPRVVETARRLIILASFRSYILPRTRSLLAVTPKPQSQSALQTTDAQVALLPFFPSPSHLIPWESLKISFAALMFRLKRNTRWWTGAGPTIALPPSMEYDSVKELVSADKDAGASEGDIDTTRATSAETLGDMVDTLRPEGLTDCEPVTTLTFGHFLITQDTDSSVSSLSPPLKGEMPVEATIPFLKSIDRPVFSPGLTPSMVRSPPTSNLRRMRRLRYRTLDGQETATFTYTHPSVASLNDTVYEEPVEEDATANWLAKLDDMIARLTREDKEKGNLLGSESSGPANALGSARNHSAEVRGSEDVQGAENAEVSVGESGEERELPMAEDSGVIDDGKDEASQAVEEHQGGLTARLSSIREVDLMMTDQPIDARLAVESPMTLAAIQIPAAITDFMEAYSENLPAAKPSGGGSLEPHEIGQSRIQTKPVPPPPAEITLPMSMAMVSPSSTDTNSAASSSDANANVNADGPSGVQQDGENIPASGEPEPRPEPEGVHYLLEADEDVEITEETIDNVTRRIVRIIDMTIGVERVVSHSELEYAGHEVPPNFWIELGRIGEGGSRTGGSGSDFAQLLNPPSSHPFSVSH